MKEVLKMLVIGSLSDTLSYISIAVIVLLSPWFLAFSADSATKHGVGQLSVIKRWEYFAAWFVAMGALAGVWHITGNYFGEIALIFYKVLSVLSALFTFIFLTVSSSNSEIVKN